MRRVIIESPYTGDAETHKTYARRCIRDSLQRGETPIASHLLFTQHGILDDNIIEEREWGINAIHSWIEVADAVIFYTDYGVGKGMASALERSIQEKRTRSSMGQNSLDMEERTIGSNPV